MRTIISYQLRQATDFDTDFLYRVYAGTRESEMILTGWENAPAEQFLRFQFNIQNYQYRNSYHNASFDIICIGSEPAGRLYVNRSENQVRIIDIALLPEYRNRGIGTAILKSMISEANTTHRPVTLSVTFDNPAVALYKRLGFIITGDDGVYCTMEYPVGAVDTLCTV
jgi:ribosomal protein S18 acetylase RimI-like enzyme